MSISFVDIGYDLTEGIFTVLDGNVTYNGTTYPVYKSIPKTPATVYVWIGDVAHTEDGTKDGFIYTGTVSVKINDESKERADMKLTQGILNIIRGLLKATKGVTFAIGGVRTLVVFSHNSMSSTVSMNDDGITKVVTVDMYNFIIQ
jgi:hypothetical protein